MEIGSTVNFQPMKIHYAMAHPSYSRDFGPFLITAYFKYFTFQVAREIIEDTRTENRF